MYLVCNRTYHFLLLVDNCCALVVPKYTLNLRQIHCGVVVIEYPSRNNGPMNKTPHIVAHYVAQKKCKLRSHFLPLYIKAEHISYEEAFVFPSGRRP
jgi:hypothetical protein